MALHHSPRIVTSGLVLALDAADRNSYAGSGTTWSDLSGNGNNVSLTNGPTYSNSNGGSIVFDGTNDYAITSLNATPSLNITSQITLDVWIKSTALANGSHGDGLISKGVSSDGNAAVYELLLLPAASSNYPYFRIFTTVARVYSTSIILIPVNSIANITCTYNGAIMRIFINGVESGVGNAVAGNIQANTEQLTIGVRYSQKDLPGIADSFYTGNIYSSKIYNRSLSPTEILQNYNATKSRYGL